MMTAPPMMRTHLFVVMAVPMSPAAVPSARKIIDRPMLKATELRMTARRAARRASSSSLLRWSMLTPEIRDT
jgi:hypothetical protein